MTDHDQDHEVRMMLGAISANLDQAISQAEGMLWELEHEPEPFIAAFGEEAVEKFRRAMASVVSDFRATRIDVSKAPEE